MDFFKVYNRLRDIQDYLFPGQCILCLDTTPHDQLVCDACTAELPSNDYGCRRCGKPMPVSVEQCGECEKTNPAFDFVRTLYRYQPPVDQLVQQMKYNGKLHLAKYFGEKLREVSAAWIRESGRPDLIVPVPLHRSRIRKRGFNQSIEIARACAKYLGVRMEIDSIQRIRKTESQTELPVNRRRTNIRGAFESRVSLRNMSIVVIDDVITSGHTVNELARVLKKAGAARVGIWGIARA